MKVFSQIKFAALKVWRSSVLKYAVACIFGVLWVGFLDENSLASHLKNQRRISELEDEIAAYNAAFQRTQSQIRELNRDPKAMEKIARERYFMKADDEDIFILSDDSRDAQLPTDHETVE